MLSVAKNKLQFFIDFGLLYLFIQIIFLHKIQINMQIYELLLFFYPININICIHLHNISIIKLNEKKSIIKIKIITVAQTFFLITNQNIKYLYLRHQVYIQYIICPANYKVYIHFSLFRDMDVFLFCHPSTLNICFNILNY